MKILQIFNRYLEYGGEEGCVRRIASALGKGHDLETFYGSTDEELAHPLGRLRMPFLMQKNQSVLSRLARLQGEEKFDFWEIHNVFPAVSVATYELAEKMQIPVVQYLHNYRFGCVNGTYYRDGNLCRDCSPGKFGPGIRHGCWRGSRLASAAMSAALNRAWNCGSIASIHKFIAISQSQKEAHVEMGIPAEKIEVIPHFLDAGEPPAKTAGEKGDVLFLGRITEEKGLRLLLDAWSRVDAGGRKLRIVGDGPHLEEIKVHAKQLKVVDVIFEGFVPKEKHAELWENASLLVAPSVWREPFGMVVLEAWQQGRPVLATKLGSFPELIQDGGDGWLAEPDPESFAAGLRRALDPETDAEKMGAAGHARLEAEFNEERWLNQIDEVYQGIRLDPVESPTRPCQIT